MKIKTVILENIVINVWFCIYLLHCMLLYFFRLYTAASAVVNNKTTNCLDVQTLKDLLRDLFLTPRLNDSLIILDDACSEVVLRHFDIGCKCVITTQNKNILCREDAKFIEVRISLKKNGLFPTKLFCFFIE